MTYEEIEAAVNEALRLRRDEGEYEAAVQILIGIVDQGHRLPAVIGVLGAILYYDIRDVERAMPFLTESVARSRNPERASKALFLALLDLRQCDAAFAEAKRYAKTHPEAYEELLSDEGVIRARMADDEG